MPTISTTGQMENVALEMMTALRYTMEHNSPIYGLVSHFALGDGEDTGIFPKVGQMTWGKLTEGEEITTEQEIGLTTVSVTPGESGAKIILTDKLLRQQKSVNFRSVGKQLGEGQVRLRETDLADLFTGLNASTALGAAGAPFSLANAISCVSIAKTNKYGENLHIVHHPNAVMRLARDLTGQGSGQLLALPEGPTARLLGRAWTGLKVWDVPVVETGNLTRDASDDANGVIMDKEALGFLQSQAPKRETERKATLRATVLVMVTDYAAFELDDTKGAALLYDAVNPATS